MFKSLKKKSKIGFENWQVDAAGFEMIVNDKSIQYVNPDGTRVIYLSVLVVGGDKPISPTTLGSPTLVEDNDGWNFKGTKSAGREVLVCVISFKHPEDGAWARSFFDSVVPVAH